MSGNAAWAIEVDDDVLVARFGRQAVERGRVYAARGRVEHVDVGGTSDLVVVSARVRGSSYRTYQTVVTHQVGASARAVTSRCSCPVGSGCKHAVAVLLVVRSKAARRAVPSWERVLRGVAEEAGAGPQGAPLALQFTWNEYSELKLRPLVRGSSGKWIKTGVNWDAVAGDHRGGDYDAAHREALADIHAASARDRYYPVYYGQQNDLALSDTRPGIWAALRAARDAGVQFVSANGTPPIRLLDEAASVIVEIDREPTGGLRLSTTLEVPGAQRGSSVRIVGRPGHGVCSPTGDALVLAALERPMTESQQALLSNRSALTVPEADIAQFAVGYLPTLRRVLDVRVAEGVELPEVTPPVAALDVTFHPGHRAVLRWTVRYRVGDQALTVGVAPRHDDPPVRDQTAERTLFASLPEGPWPSVELAEGDRRPVGEAILGGRDTIDLATTALPLLQALDGVEVTVRGDVPDYRESQDAPQVRLAVREADNGVTDWFNLAVDVTLGDEVVPFTELFRALAQGEDHLVLASGTWFGLDRPELEQLRQLIAEARELGEDAGGQLRLRVEHAGLWEELVKLGVVAEQAESWRRAVTGLLDMTTVPSVDVPAGVRATLRPYQEEGFRWLSFLWASRLGGILADDMGLGKTLQVLTVAAAAHERGELASPVLVVAPTSVLGTWAGEAERFTPGLTVRVVTQTEAKRGATLAEVADGAQIVVTSYTLLRLGADEYVAQPWSAVVLDEAQFVKNRHSKVYQAVRRLRAGVRFAITGTPLENNLMDLWSLLSVTCPGLFPDPDRFAELYRRPIEDKSDADALPRLRRRIRPVLLRRTKELVAAELPPKQEQVLSVPLTPAHRRIYDRQLQAERRKVLGLVGDLNKNRIAIFRSLTILRQLSLSASLVDPRHPAQSAKIDALVELLTELAAEGHRALVFSQFTSFLALVRARLTAEGLGYQYLDGRTRDRAARIDAFRTGTDPAFLISLKAGGFGLTLTEADYVFVLDPWWNPAAELQAIDRTHRIGQDKQVIVYRLVSADTIEEKVVALQERKRDLFARVVGADGDLAAPLSAADIRGLLDL